MPKILILCIFTLFASSNLAAQTPSETPNNPPDYRGPVNTSSITGSTAPKQISGGVLNGKAISLPKPPYPVAARAVGASGSVTVQVLIDENGDVVSANAVSGHPLLRAGATEAARGAKFSPTRLQGLPVKVSGVITYNFVGPLYPARLGFTLSHAERTASFGRYSTPESLAYQLPTDWAQEKEILNSLTFEEIPVVPPKTEGKNQPERVTGKDSSSSAPRDTNRYTVKGD
ncbi:MAG: TonB family protein, partial [Blastocatellia bacterium]